MWHTPKTCIPYVSAGKSLLLTTKTMTKHLTTTEVKFRFDNRAMYRTDTQRKRELEVAAIMEKKNRKDLADWARAGRFTLILDDLRKSRKSIDNCATDIIAFNS